jgi:hypothetical protein
VISSSGNLLSDLPYADYYLTTARRKEKRKEEKTKNC